MTSRGMASEGLLEGRKAKCAPAFFDCLSKSDFKTLHLLHFLHCLYSFSQAATEASPTFSSNRHSMRSTSPSLSLILLIFPFSLLPILPLRLLLRLLLDARLSLHRLLEHLLCAVCQGQ